MEFIWSPEAIQMLARILGLAFAIPFHEVAHAWVSDKLGDPTARMLGRLSLNPIKHIDVLGLLSMLTIGVGWAKPVPVNPAFYHNKKGGMALTAVAGPAANLLLATAAMVVYKMFVYSTFLASVTMPDWAWVVAQILDYFIFINITLMLFNLLPIPPLDGSRILLVVLPERLYFSVQRYERYMMLGLLAVAVLLPRVFNINVLGWLGTLSSWVGVGLNWLTRPVDLLFDLLI